jgi:hypothetical protein
MRDRIPNKTEIISDLLTLAREGKERSTRDFWLKYGDEAFTLDDFRRKFQEVIAQLIDDPNKEYFICANGRGFYIARNREQAQRGLDFIWSKLDDPLKRFHKNREWINKNYPPTEEELKQQKKKYKNSVVPGFQESLF